MNYKILKWLFGLYQIAGGLLGIYYFINPININTTVWEITLKIFIAVPFFILSILAGFSLINMDKWRWSIVNQFFQIIQFKFTGIAFYYISGIYLGFGYIFNDRWFFDFSIFETFIFIRLNQPGGKSLIGVSFINILLFIYFIYMNRSKKEDVQEI